MSANEPGPELHRKLRELLSEVCRDVSQIVQDVRSDKHGLPNYIDVILRVDQAAAACDEALDDSKVLIQYIEQQAAFLNDEMKQLDAREKMLTLERDDLLARGHELYWRGNCRELESNLADSFVAREQCISVDSARSFRDEAGEKLCRVSDQLRIAEIRSSVLDNEIHSATKDLGQSLEKWRQGRSEWVETLDNLLVLQTAAIKDWMKGDLMEEKRRLGERTLDYLQLQQQERHLSVQAVQSALGMRTFNASLEFDYNSNQIQLQHLDELQSKLHVFKHEPGVFLHAAQASTDLVRDQLHDELDGMTDPDEGALPASCVSESEYRQMHEGGKTLHRCSKVIDLAEGHETQGPGTPRACKSWTEEERAKARQTADGAADVSEADVRQGRENSDDSIYDEDDDALLMGAVSSMGTSRPSLNQLGRARSTIPVRRRRGSELLAKGDTDSKVDVVPTVRSNTVTSQSSPPRDPFLVRLRRRFSFTPRSESMTLATVNDEIKLRTSDSEPAHSQ